MDQDDLVLIRGAQAVRILEAFDRHLRKPSAEITLRLDPRTGQRKVIIDHRAQHSGQTLTDAAAQAATTLMAGEAETDDQA